MEEFKLVTFMAGTLVWVIGFLCFVEYVFSETKKFIETKKFKYKQKHRFDKPPTAKCYCIDCKFRGSQRDYRECSVVNRYVADEWFCNEADPKTK